MVLHPDGHFHIDALRSRAGGTSAVMITFDVLEFDGRDLRAEPLEHRRAVLVEILEGAPDGLVFSEAIEGDGTTIFRPDFSRAARELSGSVQEQSTALAVRENDLKRRTQSSFDGGD